ncbi:hypothetical protein Poli38472_009875 [Pythium oligandrum]|uniref:protein O-GlcNAc transferase n=1 Tax=Pythium oligandrum TaxID=41045 RepID=A0A8K1CHU4_PYTOL|nr:hypothetical protein Poli38472_009875 [Pythium oligandrum]|eukprot:TMW62382.1 hypothetical protein Poli38472_009875 [Pythium oligandrum]
MGAVYREKRELDAALECYARALTSLPMHAMLHVDVGRLHYDRQMYADAIASYETALSLDPTLLGEHVAHALALSYHYQQDHATAERFFRQVTKQTTEFHFDLAVTLTKLGKITEACDEYNRALAKDPTFGAAWLNIATLHHQYGDVSDAIPNYLRALALTDDRPELRLMALTNVAIAYEQTRDIHQALGYFHHAQQLLPLVKTKSVADERVSLAVHVARAKRTACIWDAYEDTVAELLQHAVTDYVERGRPNTFMPFDSLMYPMDPLVRLRIARVYSSQISTFPSTHSPASLGLIKSTRPPRLRVAYLSYDFSDHPTLNLMQGVFAHVDRSTTVLLAFGYGRDDGSECRQRMMDHVDEFVNLADSSLEKSVRAIRDRQVHVLMDAQGHTLGSRPQIAAARPAPIVVNYLVYPGTSGASYVDYLISDRFVTPPDTMSQQFSEKLVLLPASYQVNYYNETVTTRATLWQESDEAKTDVAFVFVNFNKIDKLEPSVVALWMAILRRVPGSLLQLLDPSRPSDAESATSAAIKQNLRREAMAHGVAPSRVHFVPRVPKHEHLRRHRLAGLFLDTFVYGAHSTATDALFAGLPVLTLAGDAFASRVGNSLLANVAMRTPLVTASRKEYEELAVRIATTPSLHERLQHQLRAATALPPLFQTAQHVRSLEASQRAMVTVYQVHESPMHLIVV